MSIKIPMSCLQIIKLKKNNPRNHWNHKQSQQSERVRTQLDLKLYHRASGKNMLVLALKTKKPIEQKTQQ